jgi:glycerol-3-phosphate dehydrogenase
MQSRSAVLESIHAKAFDVCVIGAGATGSGSALDSQLRGMKTVLLDASDFASGASTAATKIIHGGVRYLEEAVTHLDPAQYEVVKRALHERIHMLHNGPFLSRQLEFLIPCPGWFSVVYMGFGMKLYDWIAGKDSLFPSKFLSRTETMERMPGLAPDRFIGSIAYADGQFDDARYNLALIHGPKRDSQFRPAGSSTPLAPMPTQFAALPPQEFLPACDSVRALISCCPLSFFRPMTLC